MTTATTDPAQTPSESPEHNAAPMGPIGRAAGIVATPWVSWLVLVLWFVMIAATGPLQPKLQDSTTNESSKFLPASAESTEVTRLLQSPGLAQAETVPAIVVVQSEDGEPLTDDQLQTVSAASSAIEGAASDNAALAGTQSPFGDNGAISPGAAEQGLVSADGSTVLINLALDSPDSDVISDTVADMRDVIDEQLDIDGVNIWVTGPAGISADAIEVFGSIDVTLLIGTSILVLVLLLIIYRSPIIAFIPLIAAFSAYTVSAGVLYLLIEPLDLIVSGQTTGIMTVLIFGATTDYCLLIVARYREELTRHESRHAAMRKAVGRTTPAILSSGGTVIAAMFVLLLADLASTSSLGPALIIGVAMSMLSGLTLLPALLLVVGRRAFWPAVPRYGDDIADKRGFWGAVGERIARKPQRWLISTTLALLIMAAGIFTVDNGRLSDLDFFLGTPDSVAGLEALSETLPAGALAPGTLVVTGPNAGDVDTSAVVAAARLNANDDIATAFPIGGGMTEDGDALAVVQFTTAENPYGDEAVESIPDLRDAVDGTMQGSAEAFIGGPTAQQHDIGEANRRDLSIIVPGVLLSIFAVLILLLRALVAPLVLLGTVILSFAASLGIAYVVFIGILGQPGIDPGTITFIFLFTSALGIDYNIFLVARIREEAARLGTREGTITALRTTGGVITSAGVILAGTFLILGVLPLLPLRQLGIAVAIGVLVDTILVRGMLVPSAIYLLGDRAWWPSKSAETDATASNS